MLKIDVDDHIKMALSRVDYDWTFIGNLANEIYESKHWKMLGFKNYDEFRIDFSSKLRIDKSSLHRFRTAVKNYNTKLVPNYGRLYKFPDSIPRHVSAIGIEYLMKISEHANDEDFTQLLDRYFSMACGVSELKALWKRINGVGTRLSLSDIGKFASTDYWFKQFAKPGIISYEVSDNILATIFTNRRDETDQLVSVAFMNEENENMNLFNYKWVISENANITILDDSVGIVGFRKGSANIIKESTFSHVPKGNLMEAVMLSFSSVNSNFIKSALSGQSQY